MSFLKQLLPEIALKQAVCIDLEELHQSLVTIPTSLPKEHILALVSIKDRSGMTGIRTTRKAITNLPSHFVAYKNEAGKERFMLQHTISITREHDIIMGLKGCILFQNPITSGQCRVDFQVGEKNLPENSKTSPVMVNSEAKDNGFHFDIHCIIPVLTLPGYRNHVNLEIFDLDEKDVCFNQILIKEEVDVVTLDIGGRDLLVCEDPIIWKCKNQLAVFWKGSYMNTDIYELNEKDLETLKDLQPQLLPISNAPILL
jgi:hypothetical protein